MFDVAVSSRRGFLAAGAGLIGASLLPGAALAAPFRSGGERALAFYHTHTGETLKTVYWADGSYVPGGLNQLNHLLRDFRTGDIDAIDPKLFDILAQAQRLTGAEGKRFEIISGYRSPKTNEMLRGASEHSGVAKHSQHELGKAIDVRLPGVDLANLRKAGLAIQGGGVGYYPDSNFVHMDTGRVRYW